LDNGSDVCNASDQFEILQTEGEMNKMSQLFNYDLAGKRIRLISTTDPYTRLHKNSQGIIKFSFKNAVLDKECIAVNWFDGSSTLSLVCGVDQFEILEPEGNKT